MSNSSTNKDGLLVLPPIVQCMRSYPGLALRIRPRRFGWIDLYRTGHVQLMYVTHSLALNTVLLYTLSPWQRDTRVALHA